MEDPYLHKVTIFFKYTIICHKGIRLYQVCHLFSCTENKDFNLKHYINRRGLIKT